jgi:antitermination protein Q
MSRGKSKKSENNFLAAEKWVDGILFGVIMAFCMLQHNNMELRMAQAITAEIWEGYIEERLEEWGKWARQGETAGLYYPTISNVGKVIGSGATFIDRNYKPDSDNPRAEEIDKLVSLYAKTHSFEAKLLQGYYVDSKPKEYLAKKFQISVTIFYERLKRAKAWLEGCLVTKS